MKPFDPTDSRCIFPKFGKATDAAMQAKGYTNTRLALALGIDHTAVAGYRRGFSRPTDAARIALMEKLLGVKLNTSEPRPSVLRKTRAANAAQPSLPLDDPRLTHLAALALAMGFEATFVPVSA
jgi:transcriptional regulator with XRE-family HTH domain